MKSSIIEFITFVITFVILRDLVIKYLPVNMYVLLFIITFGLIQYFSKNYNIALFFSLITVIICTIYRYIYDATATINKTNNLVLFLLYSSILFYIIKNTKNIKYDLRLSNFIIIVYMFYSMTELFIHKYVMHCSNDFNLWFSFLSDKLNNLCKSHKEHHLHTEPDMNMEDSEKGGSYYRGLHFRWDECFWLVLISFLTIIISSYISNFNINIIHKILLSLLISFIYCYLWNKVHKDMHKIKNDFSILDGPYDNGIFDLTSIKNFLFGNHELHHLQKGEKKGNYNVILFGADEWFNHNNNKVDNDEYCKQHKNEKICQIK